MKYLNQWSVRCLIFLQFLLTWCLWQRHIHSAEGQVDNVFTVIPRSVVASTLDKSFAIDWPAQWPPVYWINASGNSQRSRETLNMMETYSINNTRIHGPTAEDARRLTVAGNVSVNCTLIPKCVDMCTRHQKKGEFLYSDVAVTLGHLSAIKAAFRDNVALALIAEDDIDFDEALPMYLAAVLSKSPTDWQVLQINVRNPAVLDQFSHIRDPVVNWHREYWGTGAYIINRAGMSDLLSRFAPSTGLVHLSDSPTADWLIYSYLRTYVSTKVMTNSRGSNARSQREKKTDVSLTTVKQEAKHFAPVARGVRSTLLEKVKMLAITTIHGNVTHSDLKKTVALLRDNVVELRRFNVNWHVWIILWRGYTQKSEWEQEIWSLKDLAGHKNLNIEYRYWDYEIPVYNKFHFYAEMVDSYAEYSYVLVHDNDMMFTGFPWLTFFDRLEDQAGKALVSGVVRRSVGPKLHASLRDSSFVYVGAKYWQACSRGKIKWAQVEFVEQWFTAISGAFFQHLLKDVVIPIHVGFGKTHPPGREPDLFSAWGLDMIWCRAADAHGGRCALFPLTMRHMNWKTITSRKPPSDLGMTVLEAYQKWRPDWMIRNHAIDLWENKRCDKFRSTCQDHSKFYWVPDAELESLPECVNISSRRAQ